MVITDRFVFVHQGKTGGTFVREVIKAAAQAELAEIPFGPLRRVGLLPCRFQYDVTPDKHDTCHEIPREHQHKKIVSIVRDPFDFYVSVYHFGWWVTHPEDSYRDLGLVKRAFPSFPDLSFEQFLALANGFFDNFDMVGDVGSSHRLGYYSTQFLQYFFRAPTDAYWRIDTAYLANHSWDNDMFQVDFLRTATLNHDLHQYLASQSYPRRYIGGVLRKPRILPPEYYSPRPNVNCKKYYTPETYNLVREKESLLFAMFPDLGIDQTYEEWMADRSTSSNRCS